MTKKMIMIYIGLFLVMMVSIGVNYPTWIVPILLVLFVANILLQLVKNKNRAVKETLELMLKGVDIIQGEARVMGPDCVKVSDKE